MARLLQRRCKFSSSLGATMLFSYQTLLDLPVSYSGGNEDRCGCFGCGILVLVNNNVDDVSLGAHRNDDATTTYQETSSSYFAGSSQNDGGGDDKQSRHHVSNATTDDDIGRRRVSFFEELESTRDRRVIGISANEDKRELHQTIKKLREGLSAAEATISDLSAKLRTVPTTWQDACVPNDAIAMEEEILTQ